MSTETRSATAETQRDGGKQSFESIAKKIEVMGWFSQHEAALVNEHELIWAEPGTGINRLIYIINNKHGGCLVVIGDLGEAVYQWSQPITFDWLGRLDGSYFASKCQASEVGPDYRQWNADHARVQLIEYLQINEIVVDQDDLREALAACDDRHDWIEWMRGDGQKVLGECWIEFTNIGMVPHVRCVCHWLGLRMIANKQAAQSQASSSASSACSAVNSSPADGAHP